MLPVLVRKLPAVIVFSLAARSVVKVDVGVYADKLTSSVLPVLVKKLPAVMVSCLAARSVVNVDDGVYADRSTSNVLPVLVRKLPAVMVFSLAAKSVVKFEVGVYAVNIKLICTAFSHNEASKLIVFPTMDIEAPATNVSCFPFNNPCIWLVVL